MMPSGASIFLPNGSAGDNLLLTRNSTLLVSVAVSNASYA
jgi:hypothetical protein